MRIPEFTAESSLCSKSKGYRALTSPPTTRGIVQQRKATCRVFGREELLLVFGIDSEYGGMVCVR